MVPLCPGGGSGAPADRAGATREGMGVGGQRAVEAGGGGGELLLTTFREQSSRLAGLRFSARSWAPASGPVRVGVGWGWSAAGYTAARPGQLHCVH